MKDPCLQCVVRVADEMQRVAECCTEKISRYPVLKERIMQVVNQLFEKMVPQLESYITNTISIHQSFVNIFHPDFFEGGTNLSHLSEQMQVTILALVFAMYYKDAFEGLVFFGVVGWVYVIDSASSSKMGQILPLWRPPAEEDPAASVVTPKHFPWTRGVPCLVVDPHLLLLHGRDTPRVVPAEEVMGRKTPLLW